MQNANAHHALLTTGGVAAAYLILYSGFDKATQQYKIGTKLKAIFGFSNRTLSLNELNKVAGLTAMSTVSAACVAAMWPTTRNTAFTTTLARYALNIGFAHGAYSAVQFSSRFFGPKRLAMSLGSISVWSLALWNMSLGNTVEPKALFSRVEGLVGKHAPAKLGAFVSTVVYAHVLVMETNVETGQLVMRPFGKLGLIIAGVTAVASITAVLSGQYR